MRIYNSLSILLMMVAAGFSACSQEEETGKGMSVSEGLRITVTDQGFRNVGASNTRADEEGYYTKFVDGDAIGVYGVNSDGTIVDGIDNKKFTLENGSWTLDGSIIEYDRDEFQHVTFYAYYPYSENVMFEPDSKDPFATYAENWTLGSNQADGEYMKYDLMTSVGTVEDNRLKGNIVFPMAHRMALALIKMPNLVYNFTNTDVTLDNYELSVSPSSFTLNDEEAFPYYQESTETYRFLVRPGSQYTIAGTYTGAKDMKYETTGTLESGSAKLYTINDADMLDYQLAIGDYYCADGSLASREGNVPDNAIGIVCYVGNPHPSVTHPSNYTEMNDALRRDYPNCTHGLVLSLNNAVYNGNSSKAFHGNSDTSVTYGDWFSSDEEWVGKFDNCNTANSVTVPETRYPAFLGYNNTTLLTMCYEGKGVQSVCDPAYSFIMAYREVVPVPSVTSPWYIPSVVCWNQVASNYNIINNSLGQVEGGEQMQSVENGSLTGHYWSSTQRNGTFQWTHGMEGGNYAITCERDSRAGFFRMMLAF